MKTSVYTKSVGKCLYNLIHNSWTSIQHLKVSHVTTLMNLKASCYVKKDTKEYVCMIPVIWHSRKCILYWQNADQWLTVKRGIWLQRGMRKLVEILKFFCILILVMVIPLHKFDTTKRPLLLCNFYLNKSD